MYLEYQIHQIMRSIGPFGLPYVRLASRRPSARPTTPAEIPALVVGCVDCLNMGGFTYICTKKSCFIWLFWKLLM